MKRALSFALAVLAVGSGCSVQPDDEAREPTGATEEAVTVNGYAWAWVQSNGAVGTPYTYDSAPGGAASSKLATGQYEVVFNGLHSAGSPQVVAYGSSAHCKLFTIPLVSGTKVSSYVNCYSAAGTLTDSAFVITFDSRTGADSAPYRGGYLSTGGGTAPTLVGGQWSSSGTTPSVSWDSATQEFVASFPGASFSNAAVHVTAYGANANRCKVASYGSGFARVKCFDANHLPVASGFSISFMEKSLVAGHIGGHARVSFGAPAVGYSAAVGTSSCGGAGSVSTTTYPSTPLDLDVNVSDSDWGGDWGPYVVPLVTAYGSGNDNYCNVLRWGASTTTGASTVTVRCFNGQGQQINASSTELMSSITNWSWPGPC
jgi:hypothetical protein